MSIWELFSIQGTLFIMILAGTFLRKKGILDENGTRCLTDLCVSVVIPCNIIQSCLIEFDVSILRTCGLLFIVGFVTQLICVVFNRFLFNRYPEQQKKVLQYVTLVSNSGFLGYPVAEGVYGSLGLLYASVFLIPMRIVMWSVGTSYFVAGTTDWQKVMKNVLTHPCLIAVYIGLLVMFTQIQLPSIVTMPIKYIGSCNAALTMFIIGTIMADVPLHTIVNRTTLCFSVFRLAILPAITLALCLPLAMDTTAVGVSVIMMGMPAASTSAIFAARYHSDAPFATKCVVLSTLLSMLTIPVWCYFIG